MTHEYMIRPQSIVVMHMALQLNSNRTSERKRFQATKQNDIIIYVVQVSTVLLLGSAIQIFKYYRKNDRRIGKNIYLVQFLS